MSTAPNVPLARGKLCFLLGFCHRGRRRCGHDISVTVKPCTSAAGLRDQENHCYEEILTFSRHFSIRLDTSRSVSVLLNRARPGLFSSRWLVCITDSILAGEKIRLLGVQLLALPCTLKNGRLYTCGSFCLSLTVALVLGTRFLADPGHQCASGGCLFVRFSDHYTETQLALW
jgi:hypothetical protein